jgi:hypothetical protein
MEEGPFWRRREPSRSKCRLRRLVEFVRKRLLVGQKKFVRLFGVNHADDADDAEDKRHGARDGGIGSSAL